MSEPAPFADGSKADSATAGVVLWAEVLRPLQRHLRLVSDAAAGAILLPSLGTMLLAALLFAFACLFLAPVFVLLSAVFLVVGPLAYFPLAGWLERIAARQTVARFDRCFPPGTPVRDDALRALWLLEQPAKPLHLFREALEGAHPGSLLPPALGEEARGPQDEDAESAVVRTEVERQLRTAVLNPLASRLGFLQLGLCLVFIVSWGLYALFSVAFQLPPNLEGALGLALFAELLLLIPYVRLDRRAVRQAAVSFDNLFPEGCEQRKIALGVLRQLSGRNDRARRLLDQLSQQEAWAGMAGAPDARAGALLSGWESTSPPERITPRANREEGSPVTPHPTAPDNKT